MVAEWKPDEDGVLRETRYEVVGSVECNRCGSTVELEADGWRVYCVPAAGALAQLLRAHGEAAWPEARS